MVDQVADTNDQSADSEQILDEPRVAGGGAQITVCASHRRLGELDQSEIGRAHV